MILINRKSIGEKMESKPNHEKIITELFQLAGITVQHVIRVTQQLATSAGMSGAVRKRIMSHCSGC